MAPPKTPPDAEQVKRLLETTRELEALVARQPRGEPDPDAEAFQAFINFQEFPDEARVALLSEFLELVLPDLGRCAEPLRSTVLFNRDASEQELEALNGWCGVVPARVRRLDWLDAPALKLAGGLSLLGTQAAQADESGMVLGRTLHVLLDGRLALVHMVGTWTNPNKMARLVTTLADARILEPWEALQQFSLHPMLRALRSCLWGKATAPGEAPHAPQLEARRARFTALVTGLDQATRAHAERLRRVGDEPA